MVDFNQLAQQCAPSVHPVTMQAIARTESGFNPYAIGVVGGRLARQPRDSEEAVATARALDARGINFSVGLGQVNRFNLARYGLTYVTAFDPCANLCAGSAILYACYQRASAAYGQGQRALRAAISCYYSGDFVGGERAQSNGSSYVQRVVANARSTAGPVDMVPAIPVIMDRPAGTTTQVGAGERKSSPTSHAVREPRQDAPHPSWDAFGDFGCDSDSCR
ncbi:Soluble lytic murein transglycosylase-like protein [Paraburkholderia ribeironis]|uniref:Soluble lytic murein transglycosylase-like protein n=1 Tax=Paraburkholderia ribeironis TaxID=1247936 RepID=A0A1N7RUH4_9BURK|nr:lytic transglycosylase domain-containing protein [Paraburkholderia ribeironis]SIT38754.1 Soluble lytic murein transglycosylase-like protein [Paraburkholderia ribeironis]